jgi:Flp pilus assembly protein TadD
MSTTSNRGGAACRRAIAVCVVSLLPCGGCALIPTWEDVHNATTTVKDTLSGKARRDRQTQTLAEARIFERRRDFVSAEKLYRELLAEVPRSRDCYHRLAVMAAVQGKFDQANAYYRTALECGNPTADLWSDLGYCHYLQQQLPEAEQALQQALALEPQHCAAMNNLAMVLGETGRFDDAYRLFRQANKEADAEANFAFLCAQCGDLQRAQMHYSRALSYDPEMRVATEALLQVTQRMQMQLDHQQDQLAQAGAAGGDPSGVQLVSHEEPAAQSQRRLIEVFSSGPRPVAPAMLDRQATSPVTQLAAAQSAGPAPNPGTIPYNPSASPIAGVIPGFPQPQSAQQPPGGTNLVPQPANFPSQAQPQYLQPSANNPGSAVNYGSPGQGPGGGPGGMFPPLVNGGPTIR